MALDSMQEIFDKIQAGRKPFWQVVRDTDVEERQVTAEASFEKMHATWRAMVESVDTYRADRRSVSGLVGGDAQRMWDYAAQQETLCGPYLQEVIATALCVAESNACMHRIVAAPTAGACGVLPAVLVPLYRRGAVDEEAIVRALYVAAGIGAVVGYRASISGVAPSQIIIDPGLGFSKPSVEHNFPLMVALERFNSTGYPVLIGASRKRFVSAALNDAGIGEPTMDDRDNVTAALSALCAEHGAWAVRVHDVRRSRAALTIGSLWRQYQN